MDTQTLQWLAVAAMIAAASGYLAVYFRRAARGGDGSDAGGCSCCRPHVPGRPGQARPFVPSADLERLARRQADAARGTQAENDDDADPTARRHP